MANISITNRNSTRMFALGYFIGQGGPCPNGTVDHLFQGCAIETHICFNVKTYLNSLTKRCPEGNSKNLSRSSERLRIASVFIPNKYP